MDLAKIAKNISASIGLATLLYFSSCKPTIPLPPEECFVYKVEKGDNLYKIAKKLCGNSKEWKVIAVTNTYVNPDFDPDKIYPGQEILVPKYCNKDADNN